MTDALIFDCDGVLSDTERYGHLVAFNQTFARFGLPLRWSDEQYRELLRIGGGKERLATVLTPEFVAENSLPADPGRQRDLIADWHREKTKTYTAMVMSGQLPARPGILRLVEEASAAGWKLAVASTSAELSVRAVLEHAVGLTLAHQFSVFAGDSVAAKKPAPDIYLLALAGISADPRDTVAIEDSSNGLRASSSAGICTVVTESSYTRGEDFSSAALVVDSLGDLPAEPASVIHNPLRLQVGAEIGIDDLIRVRAAARLNEPSPGARL